MKLTFRQLEVFAATSRAPSFSEAAKRLGVAQPSVSAAVRKIESDLGVRLFDRTTRSLKLTPEGRALAAVAEDLVRDVETALESIGQRLGGRRGRIAIAALPSIAASLLPDVLRDFAHDFPGIEIGVWDVLHDRAVSMLHDGVVDFAVTTQPASFAGLRFETLGSDEFHLVCRPDHPLAGQGSISWRNLAKYPFVAMAPTTSVRRFTDAAFMDNGLVIQPRYEVEQVPSAAALVAAGLGITALPILAMALFDKSRLASRPLRAPAIRRSIGILTVEDRPLSLPARALISMLNGARTHAASR